MGRAPWVWSSRLGVLAVLVAAEAQGQTEGRSEDVTSAIVSRPHTVAELEAGVIILPTAPISGAQQGGSTPIGTIGKGDATLSTAIHLLFRGGRDWALGAGALLSPTPTSDRQYGLGGASGLPRTHSRSYLFVGGEARYIPLHVRLFEGWVGLTGGAIIVADRFSTDVTNPQDEVPAILGTREVTIRSEGFSLGVEAGMSYLFAEHFVAGLTLRADRWVLPEHQECSAIGDCATLTGTVAAFEAGLTIGYRLPL